MKLTLAAAMLVFSAAPGPAHRLDEYLQGTILSIEKSRLHAEMTLTPGVSVFPQLIADIDGDADGSISEAEQRAYAARVLQDLSLTLDGHRLTPQLLSVHFPAMEEMKEGRGEIQLDYSAELPAGASPRTLVLENHHKSRISAYQVNCLVPSDTKIGILKQDRNYSQSYYSLKYEQSGGRTATMPSSWATATKWLWGAALLFSAWMAVLRRRRV